MRKSLLAVAALAAGWLLAWSVPMQNARAASQPNLERLYQFMQRSFIIPSRDDIKLVKCEPAKIRSLWDCLFKVKQQGAAMPLHLYMDNSVRQVIFGQVFDLTGDFWSRTDVTKLSLDDRPILGDPNAPVTIIEFADFQCPFCAQAASPLQEVVNNHQGSVRLVFKYLPLTSIHPWAQQGAQAAECARRQKPAAFWPVADALYKQQKEITAANFDSQFEQIASQQGLDSGQLKSCIGSPEVQARITQDVDDAKSLKIRSTPTVMVEGITVSPPAADRLEFVVKGQLEEGSRHAARSGKHAESNHEAAADSSESESGGAAETAADPGQ